MALNACPNKNDSSWKALVSAVGEFEAMRDWMEHDGVIRTPEEVKAKLVLKQTENQSVLTTPIKTNSLFGLDTSNQNTLEFHINTINVVSQFLNNIGIEQRLVPEFLSTEGTVVEEALAAANFIKGTVDIIEDVEKRPGAWDKLPEEAAHWWYRLLDTNSVLKDALLQSAKADHKESELRASLYGELPGLKSITKIDLSTGKRVLSPIREEAIGQLIAEAIKRIEDKNASAADYSFFKKFLEWINSVLKTFKNIFSEHDPFEVAAMKILSSDLSELMSWEEYNKLNNQVYFADVLTQQSVAPIDYSLIEDIGFPIIPSQTPNMFGDIYTAYKFNYSKGGILTESPEFKSQEELDMWVFKNIKVYDIRQKKAIQEITDNENFYERLLNKTFRKRTKFLPKTLKRYYKIIDSGSTQQQLREWTVNNKLVKLTKKLNKYEKNLLVQTNDYTNITPTLKVLPEILRKYKKNPIVLSEQIKIDGAKKQELSILNSIKDLIRTENPDKKTITAEEFVNEVHNWLEVNYLLGFANEQNYLGYHIDQTFINVPGRVSDDPSPLANLTEEEIQRLPLEERQRIAAIVGLTQSNPSVYHNKISVRFNDRYHEGGHFSMAPSAWGNLTYFYSGKSKFKDAVLLHEIQNDNIERLRNVKNEEIDLDKSIDLYLQQLNDQLLDNIQQIEDGEFKIEKSINGPIDVYSIYGKQYLNRSYRLSYLVSGDVPLDQAYEQLKSEMREQVSLFESQGVVNSLEYRQEQIDESYIMRQRWQDFLNKGGIKSILSKEDLEELQTLVKNINKGEADDYGPGFMIEVDPQFLPDENQMEPGYFRSTTIKEKKQMFKDNMRGLSFKINTKLEEIYGTKAPKIQSLSATAQLLPKSQRNPQRVRRGRDTITTGNTSNLLSENINWIITYNEKHVLTQLNKEIEEAKQKYVQTRNNIQKYKFDKQLSKITREQFVKLAENIKFNSDLISQLVDKQANIELTSRTGSINNSQKEYNQLFETIKYEELKQKALNKKTELKKNYLKSKNEAEQVLEIELNYFTPLVHHLIQKHINQYGKNFPMYFSGYGITQLTQGNNRTALIYAGKEEVEYTKEQADDIKKQAAVRIGIVDKDVSTEEAIKALNDFKRKSKNNLDRVIYEQMNLSGDKPIETGAIYNAMSQISGIKLIWQDKIDGIKENKGGYLVDLSNYNYTTPILYGLKTNVKSSTANKVYQDLSFFREQSDYQERYKVLTEPITLNTEETKVTRGNEIVSKLVDRISNNLGVSYSIISPEQAVEILGASNTPFNGEKAFFLGGTVYFVGDSINTETAIHELAHPLVRAISADNRSLFNNLFSQISSTPEGQDIISTVKSLYPELSEQDDLFKEEVIVRSLTKSSYNKANNIVESTGFSAFIKELLYQIKQLLRRVFKGLPIQIQNLNENTTVEELGNMLLSKEFQINTEKISDKDIAAFIKETREEILEEFAKVEGSDLFKITNRFYDTVLKQIKSLSSSKYRDVKKVLSDNLERSDLTEITTNLSPFNRNINPQFKSEEEELNYNKAHAGALLNSLLRLEVTSDRMVRHIKEISSSPITPESLGRMVYYDNLIREWGTFLIESKETLNQEVYRGEILPDNAILSLINSIIETLDRTKLYRDKIYMDGTSELISTQLQGMAKNIDDYYTQLINEKIKRKASPAEVERYKYEYDQVKLTPEKIRSLLKGELGDSHALNSFLEAFIYNQDPIIFGFSQYVKDNFIDMNGEIQNKFTSYITELEPLLKNAGYNTALERLNMGKELLFIDSRRYKGPDDIKKYYTLLNPWQNYNAEVEKLEKAVSDAKLKATQTKTKEDDLAYANAIKALNEHNRMWMHQENKPEFYEMFKMFEDEIGKLAYAAQESIIRKIQGLTTNITSIDEMIQNADQQRLYWREYKLLASEVYSNGDPKVDSPEDGVYDLSIAKRLQEFRAKSREFYVWKPRQGAFNSAYLTFLQRLEDVGIKKGSSEYEARVKDWLSQNSSISLNNKFYERRAEIFARIVELSNTPQQKKLADLFSKRANYISSYRDENGHPIGSEMPESLLIKIKNIEEEIEQIRKTISGKSGLTGLEWEEFIKLNNKIKEYQEGGEYNLSDDEIDRYYVLKKTLNDAKLKSASPEDIELADLFNELKDLQERVISQDYLDTVNEFLNEDCIDFLQKSFKLKEFTFADADLLNNIPLIDKLKQLNPEFKKWHNNNHLLTTYKKNKKVVSKYVPTSAWTHIKPKDISFYNTTDIVDDKGNVLETLYVVPGRNYSYRAVKPEYKTERKTMLDCIREGLPLEEANVDMRDRFLPRNISDSPYRKGEYHLLKSNSKEKHKLLLTLIKNHLEVQENLPRDSRLDLEQPRYDRENLEISTTYTVDGQRQNPLSVWANKIKAYFGRSPDDYEKGLNPDQNMMLVNTDLYNDNFSKIPITGIYDLSINQTSIDILRGMMRYMQSGVKQRKLKDMLPYAKALQAVLQDPDNNPDRIQNGIKQYSKTKLAISSVLSPIKNKGLSIRAQTINAFVEKEFEGKNQAGMLKDMPFINKVARSLMNVASTGFFAFNIPSAIKNSFGARFQSMIEASGGKYFNWTDYLKGTVWGNKVTSEISFEIYRFGPKSLDVQLVDLMDPSQGRFSSKISEGVGTTRSMLSDTAKISPYLTNIRKWTELNANLSIFGTMLKKTKVERKLSTGQTIKIGYDEAWELVDGKIQLKEGIDKSWAQGGSNFRSFIRKVHGVSNNLNGAYSSFDQPAANRYLLYRFVMSLKTYFTRMFMNRFQAKVTGNIFKGGKFLPRYDATTEEVLKGYYIQAFQSIVNTFKTLGKNIPSMTQDETYALKKMMTEFGLLTLISQVIVSIFFGYNPDDEEKYAKLRKKSGPLRAPFVAEDESPFHLGGWFSNHLLNLSLQVRGENEAWIPFPGFGLDDYAKLIKMEPIALKATVVTYAKMFQQAFYLMDYAITDDPSALYQREVGPYEWQQQGGKKFINLLAKSLSFTGTSVDPVVAVQNYQSSKNR